MGFIDLEKACNWVIREALWQESRKYDVGAKLLGGIKSMFVSLTCVRVTGGENERFRKERRMGVGSLCGWKACFGV